MDQLKNRGLEIPLIQGGMGVGVSLSGLAGAVAKTGAMGCISTADCGYREEDFRRAPEEANLRALRKEIQRAKLLSEGKGMIVINAMVATRQWEDAIKVAVEEGIDAVISGAGLPLSLPELVPEGTALIAPIVSSGRAAKVLLKTWSQKYQRTADFVVLEGPLAGGHLGFKAAEVEEATAKPLEELIPEVLSVLQIFEEEFGREIPLFAAGGIWTREDIVRMQEAGAYGVQMATRFIGTRECDASTAYKEYLISKKENDLEIIHSPVGMPGRAVKSPMLEKLGLSGRIAPKHCSRCIHGCDPGTVKYCITHALISAVEGNVEEGLFFSGANVEKLQEIVSVKEVVDELFPEREDAKTLHFFQREKALA